MNRRLFSFKAFCTIGMLAVMSNNVHAFVPYLVREIWPDSLSGGFPRQLTNVSGTLFFAANDGSSGIELWKSDGTEAGTILVKDINTTSVFGGSSNPHQLTNVNGTLFFAAHDGMTGVELWKSDETDAGTHLVKDINQTPEFSGFSVPSQLTDVNGTLFFSAIDGIRGRELWISDGTESGTVLVKDIAPGTATFGHLMEIIEYKGNAYFPADDGVHGIELWRSDGTETGTELVKDINQTSELLGSSVPRNFAVSGGTLFFSAADGTNGSNSELWKTDGTAVGTERLTSFGDPATPGNSSPEILTDVDGTLFFRVFNIGSGDFPLWKSDGTASGTQLVKNFNPGEAPRSLTSFDGRLFFTIHDDIQGNQLWVSDGTPDGTQVFVDLGPGIDSEGFGEMLPVGNRLFFTVATPNGSFSDHQLFVTDGTAAGTKSLLTIEAPSDFVSPSIRELTFTGTHLFFRAPLAVNEEGFLASYELFAIAIPEPGTALMVWLAAAGGVVGVTRRRRQSAAAC